MVRFLPVALLAVAAAAILVGVAQARQIRINRFATLIEQEDQKGDDTTERGAVRATVREVPPTPYPAAGQRPGRAFELPGERAATEAGETSDPGEDQLTTTVTATPLAAFSSTTARYEQYSTTLYNEVPAELTSDDDDSEGVEAAKTPYPPAGYRPSRAFDLATEEQVKPTAAAPSARKAPYPAAGYRPSRAFALPTEQLEPVAAPSQRLASQILVEVDDDDDEAVTTVAADVDKSQHPVCGVSTNPLAPKPADGAVDDPDAERVLVTAAVGPGVVVSAPVPFAGRRTPLSVRPLLELRTQPLVIPAGRSYAYAAQLRTW